jgi:hypothetical protein
MQQEHSHWYYILGWFMLLVQHNWPVLVATAVGAYRAWALYRLPTRRNVQLLYGWGLLAFTYEYIKHLRDYLAEPVTFLFTMDWAWMQPTGHFLIKTFAPLIMLGVAVAFLLAALGLPQSWWAPISGIVRWRSAIDSRRSPDEARHS